MITGKKGKVQLEEHLFLQFLQYLRGEFWSSCILKEELSSVMVAKLKNKGNILYLSNLEVIIKLRFAIFKAIT